MKKKIFNSLVLMVFFSFVLLLASCDTSDNGNSSSSTSQVTTATTPETTETSVVPTTSETTTTTEDITTTTTISVVKYTVSFNYNNGEKNSYQIVEENNKVIKPNDPTKEGYTFVNWTYDGKEWDFDNDVITKDITLEANWTINSYDVALTTNDSNGGTVSGANTYQYGDVATITATLNEGYTFVGWYYGTAKISNELSFIFTIPAEDVTLEARFSINKYTITLDNQADGVEITGITSGNEYDYGSEITLTATNIPSGYTINWTRSDGVIYYGNSYTFNVPATDITITITTNIAYTRVDNKIYFGTYPQTKVTDTALTTELNNLAGDLPTSTELGNWIDYNYYVNSEITSFMYYQDIDYDKDGDYDYRGVYFTQHRPTSNTSFPSSTTYQYNNGYYVNTTYWFSYDPIEWNILKESDGRAFIIANLILDSQDYCHQETNLSFEHNGGTGYGNNYELSDIRKWLNDNFYNTTFNALQKAIIEITEVDNSAASTGDSSNKYACNNTFDNIFLLSYQEATTYYTTDSDRQALGSDYAKVQGLYTSSSGSNPWVLRSPCTNTTTTYIVSGDGTFNKKHRGSVFIYYYDGICPACWIKL